MGKRLSSACMSAVKMATSRYRRISTLGNCVTFVIFPAAAGSALRPTAPLSSFSNRRRLICERTWINAASEFR